MNDLSPVSDAFPLIGDITDPETWPTQVRQALEAARETFDVWFNDRPAKSAKAFNRAYAALVDVAKPNAIRGWHCTRLLDREVQAIKENGMEVLTPNLVQRRVNSAVLHGDLVSAVGARLIAAHQARSQYRIGQLWFIFDDTPSEDAVERLLRQWGGEAIYWAHEADQEVAPILRRIGRPCLVEAIIPVSSLHPQFGLVEALVKNDLMTSGLLDGIPRGFEGYCDRNLPSQFIQQIWLHPDPEFVKRVRSDLWRTPLA